MIRHGQAPGQGKKYQALASVLFLLHIHFWSPAHNAGWYRRAGAVSVFPSPRAVSSIMEGGGKVGPDIPRVELCPDILHEL